MAALSFFAQVLPAAPAPGSALADSLHRLAAINEAAIKARMEHPLAQPEFQLKQHPVLVSIVVLCFLCWVLREPLRLAWASFQANRAGAPAPEPAPTAVVVPVADGSELAALRAQSTYLLDLLREGDRLTTQRALLVRLGLSDEKLADWHKANWKALAKHQLALLRAVRPVVYADYRDRVWLDSPTFGTRPRLAQATTH